MMQFAKKPKYQNKKVIVKGIKFDSKLESNIYLKILELSKTYDFSYKLQPKYELMPKFRLDGECFRAIDYIADFEICINGKVYVLDAKGLKTPVFKLKEKLFANKYNKKIICITSVKKFVEWFNGVIK